MADRGRPCKFLPEDVEELERRAEQYFESCKGEVLFDKDGNPVVDKYGLPVIYGEEPLTITGLALAFGFCSRQQMLEYQGREDFHDTITRAKAKVERYAEKRLFDKDGANGAKFSLANNFKGWSEKKEVSADVKNTVTISIDLVDDDDE